MNRIVDYKTAYTWKRKARHSKTGNERDNFIVSSHFYSKALVYLPNKTMTWLVTSDRYFLEVHSLRAGSPVEDGAKWKRKDKGGNAGEPVRRLRSSRRFIAKETEIMNMLLLMLSPSKYCAETPQTTPPAQKATANVDKTKINYSSHSKLSRALDASVE